MASVSYLSRIIISILIIININPHIGASSVAVWIKAGVEEEDFNTSLTLTPTYIFPQHHFDKMKKNFRNKTGGPEGFCGTSVTWFTNSGAAVFSSRDVLSAQEEHRNFSQFHKWIQKKQKMWLIHCDSFNILRKNHRNSSHM